MKKFDQINMIPFIDIMLVLMAIIMTTASFVESGLIEVDLPIAEQAETKIEQRSYIEITINIENEIFFKGEPVSLARLDLLLAEQHNSTPVQLRIDKGSVFESFIAVINTLKAYQFDNVSIETQSSALR